MHLFHVHHDSLFQIVCSKQHVTHRNSVACSKNSGAKFHCGEERGRFLESKPTFSGWHVCRTKLAYNCLGGFPCFQALIGWVLKIPTKYPARIPYKISRKITDELLWVRRENSLLGRSARKMCHQEALHRLHSRNTNIFHHQELLELVVPRNAWHDAAISYLMLAWTN